MILDANFKFDITPLATSGTADIVSTNVYDAGAAIKLFAGTSEKPPFLWCAATVTSGTITSLRFRFVGADNAALTTNPIIIADTGAVTLADDGSALDTTHNFFQRMLPLMGQSVAKRYYGAIYTPAGTTPVFGVTCTIVESPQTWMPARKAAVP